MASIGEKRKRVVLSIEQKIRIVERLEKGETGAKLAKEYGVGNATISDIKKAKKLRQFVDEAESSKALKTRQTMKSSCDLELDKALFTWFAQERSKGLPISGPILQAKALHFWAKLHPNDETFTASQGFIEKWKKRHGVRQLTLCGEKLSAHADDVEPFKRKLSDFIKEKNLTPAQVYNADETGLYYRCLPDKTLAAGNESDAPGMKKLKDRVTILACANAEGTHKIPLLVIGKYEKPRCFNGIARERLPCGYAAQKSAWMNGVIFKKWFDETFVPNVLRRLRQKKLPLKALLLLDNAPSHPVDLTHKTKDGAITVMYLPANTTSILQPMDQGPLESFKRLYRKNLISSLTDEEHKDMSLMASLKSLNMLTVINMASTAWQDVKLEFIKKAWKKTGIHEEQADDEDDEIDEDPIQEMRDVTKALPGPELHNIDVAEWLAIDENLQGEEELTDDAILNGVKNDEEVDEDDEQIQEDKEEKGPTHEDMVKMSDEMLKYFQNSDADPIFASHVKNIRAFCLEQISKKFKQQDIRSMFCKK